MACVRAPCDRNRYLQGKKHMLKIYFMRRMIHESTDRSKETL